MKTEHAWELNMNDEIDIERLSQKPSRKKFWILMLVLIGVIVVYALNQTHTTGTQRIEWKTQKVKRGDITVIVTATGTLKPIKEVEVGSELSGIVKRVDVDANDKVKAGQVLAVLDTSKLEAQVTQSKASLEAAKAKVRQAKATLNETRKKLEQYQIARELSHHKVPSQSEYDAAEAAVERANADEASASAAVWQAKAALDAYEADLSKSVIRSPINGVVMARSIEPGQTVAASFQAPVLFTLAEDLTQMELRVSVDEADIGQVKEGQEAAFSVDAYLDRSFKARITKIHYHSETVNGVVTYKTVLNVDNSDLSLRPGMTATADIVVNKTENVIQIPNAALRFVMPTEPVTKSSKGLLGSLLPRPPAPAPKKQEKMLVNHSEQTVWILKDGNPVEVLVKTGLTDGMATELVSGSVSEGMEVITDVITRE